MHDVCNIKFVDAKITFHYLKKYSLIKEFSLYLHIPGGQAFVDGPTSITVTGSLEPSTGGNWSNVSGSLSAGRMDLSQKQKSVIGLKVFPAMALKSNIFFYMLYLLNMF
jgi:hypothetical protein